MSEDKLPKQNNPQPNADSLPLSTSEKAAKESTDQKSPTEAKQSEVPIKTTTKEDEAAHFSQQSIDLSKSQFEMLVRREEDPTVRVEIEETKKLVEKETGPAEMTVFFFINPTSGAQNGIAMLSGGANSLAYEDLGKIHIADVTNQKSKDLAFIQLKDFQSHSHIFPFVVVGGGDGTLIYLVDEMLEKGIDVLKIKFCVLPFGTGNDLAQVTGWGSDASEMVKGNPICTFRSLLNELKSATISNINVWNIEVKCAGDNDIQYIGTRGSERVKVPTGKRVFKRRMINYFSLGGDARIGLGFEKHRGASVCWNKCCYCWEGFKKLCCISTLGINEVMMKITKLDENKDEETDILVVATKDYAHEGDSYLAGNPASILFSNIGSFMGGRSYPWKNAKQTPGVESKKPLVSANFKDESFGDDLIEILTFPSMMSISLETIMGGSARRVAQDSGPFKILFQTGETKKVTTYMNVDGEYYRLNNPKEISLQLSTQPLGGKLKIALRNSA